MGFEEEIQQPHFKNCYQKAILNLIYTHNCLRDQMQDHFSCHDLTMQQYNILRILRGANKPISTLQIRERMLDKMSDTSRIVDRLILKGLVAKNTCLQDKRLVDVVITQAGIDLLQKLEEISDQTDKLFANLSPDEAAQLNALLDKARIGCNKTI